MLDTSTLLQVAADFGEMVHPISLRPSARMLAARGSSLRTVAALP